MHSFGFFPNSKASTPFVRSKKCVWIGERSSLVRARKRRAAGQTPGEPIVPLMVSDLL